MGDFQYRPIVVPRIAGASKQLAPHVRFAESLGGEDPIEKDVALLVIAVGIHLDVAASRRDTLDLAHRLDAGLIRKIVHNIDAEDRRHAAALKGQLLGGTTHNTTPRLRVAVV